MVTVRILHGEVGDWKEGDVVTDAPLGLVNIAKKGTLNAATKQVVAVIEEESTSTVDLETLKARAKELKIPGFQNMKPENLAAAVQAAEEAQQQDDHSSTVDDQTSDSGAVNGDAKPNLNE